MMGICFFILETVEARKRVLYKYTIFDESVLALPPIIDERGADA